MLFWMEKSLTFFCFGKRISTMDDYHKFDLCTACKSKPFSIQSIKCIHVHTYTQCCTCRSLCNARMHAISSHLNYEFNWIVNVSDSNLTYALHVQTSHFLFAILNQPWNIRPFHPPASFINEKTKYVSCTTTSHTRNLTSDWLLACNDYHSNVAIS
jgi:hypothetical protein